MLRWTFNPSCPMYICSLTLLVQGPFGTFHVRQEYAGCEWTGLKFSNDGKKILISTSIGQLKLVDAFHGQVLNTLIVSHIWINAPQIIIILNFTYTALLMFVSVHRAMQILMD